MTHTKESLHCLIGDTLEAAKALGLPIFIVAQDDVCGAELRSHADGRCSGCRWWGEDKHTLAATPQRECMNSEYLHESGCPSVGDPAKSLTYQFYVGGQFWTGPDFGCVHFEPKQEEEAE